MVWAKAGAFHWISSSGGCCPPVMSTVALVDSTIDGAESVEHDKCCPECKGSGAGVGPFTLPTRRSCRALSFAPQVIVWSTLQDMESYGQAFH